MEKISDLCVLARIENMQKQYRNLEECKKKQESLIERLIAFSKEKESEIENLRKIITNLEKIVANLECDLENSQKMNNMKNNLTANLELKGERNTTISDIEENSKFTQFNSVEKDLEKLKSENQAQKELLIKMEDVYKKKLYEKDQELSTLKDKNDELKTLMSSQKNTNEK